MLALLAALAALAVWAGPAVLPAHAEGTASTVVIDASLAEDGTLTVEQVLTFADPVPPDVTQRFETRRDLLGSRQQIFRVGDFSATAGGTGVSVEASEEGDRFTEVTIPTNGASSVTLTYTVRGAVVAIDSGTALQWQILQGLSAQVTALTATIAIPGPFDYITCTAGPPNSETPCDFAAAGTDAAQIPTFRDGPRGEGEVVAVDIGFPPGAVAANAEVKELWTVGRAFSAAPLPLGLALGLLVLGGAGLLALHRRAGRDSRADGALIRAAEFVPVGAGVSEFRVLGNVRPGQVGTVADERVDPIDITATILDLAVHGHLLITELPRESEFARADWLLTRQDTSADDLHPFEVELLNGIAAHGEVKVSELPARVYDSIGAVQDKLYDEVVGNGWFERRPDSTRSRWNQMALVALTVSVVVTGLLAAFTTFGLVGLALIALALGLLFVAEEMPARTAQGSALLAGLGALRSDLLSHPTDQMPPGRELSEMSEVLPYAVVLGGSDRWIDAIVASDVDEHPDSQDLGWYHGPGSWHLSDLPDSLRNFITTVSGSLFTR